MPPPFVYYLLISSFFATGFFFVLGVTLTALFRWNVSDAFSGSAVLFYSAFLFTGVFRVIKDAWSYWPYAFHSSKFLRAVPSGTNSSGAWLKNLSPFATSGAAALFVAGVTILKYNAAVEKAITPAPAKSAPTPAFASKRGAFKIGARIVPLISKNAMVSGRIQPVYNKRCADISRGA